MTKFRPCIDLHGGEVKQIVGGTLNDSAATTVTNFVSHQPSAYYAHLYEKDGLLGGHVIMLGPGNEDAAIRALEAYPHGLQVGGGITADNASRWLSHGADKVIVTSWLFPDGQLSMDRVRQMSSVVGKERLVVDLSCRRGAGAQTWFVAINKWQTITSTQITACLLVELSQFCSEFLVHAADVEGLCQGIDQELVAFLGVHSPIPCTYAGGGKELADLQLVASLSAGRVDLTFGSALDIFGGQGVAYSDCITWNAASEQ